MLAFFRRSVGGSNRATTGDRTAQSRRRVLVSADADSTPVSSRILLALALTTVALASTYSPARSHDGDSTYAPTGTYRPVSAHERVPIDTTADREANSAHQPNAEPATDHAVLPTVIQASMALFASATADPLPITTSPTSQVTISPGAGANPGAGVAVSDPTLLESDAPQPWVTFDFGFGWQYKMTSDVHQLVVQQEYLLERFMGEFEPGLEGRFNRFITIDTDGAVSEDGYREITEEEARTALHATETRYKQQVLGLRPPEPERRRPAPTPTRGSSPNYQLYSNGGPTSGAVSPEPPPVRPRPGAAGSPGRPDVARRDRPREVYERELTPYEKSRGTSSKRPRIEHRIPAPSSDDAADLASLPTDTPAADASGVETPPAETQAEDASATTPSSFPTQHPATPPPPPAGGVARRPKTLMETTPPPFSAERGPAAVGVPSKNAEPPMGRSAAPDVLPPPGAQTAEAASLRTSPNQQARRSRVAALTPPPIGVEQRTTWLDMEPVASNEEGEEADQPSDSPNSNSAAANTTTDQNTVDVNTVGKDTADEDTAPADRSLVETSLPDTSPKVTAPSGVVLRPAAARIKRFGRAAKNGRRDADAAHFDPTPPAPSDGAPNAPEGFSPTKPVGPGSNDADASRGERRSNRTPVGIAPFGQAEAPFDRPNTRGHSIVHNDMPERRPAVGARLPGTPLRGTPEDSLALGVPPLGVAVLRNPTSTGLINDDAIANNPSFRNPASRNEVPDSIAGDPALNNPAAGIAVARTPVPRTSIARTLAPRRPLNVQTIDGAIDATTPLKHQTEEPLASGPTILARTTPQYPVRQPQALPGSPVSRAAAPGPMARLSAPPSSPAIRGRSAVPPIAPHRPRPTSPSLASRPMAPATPPMLASIPPAPANVGQSRGVAPRARADAAKRRSSPGQSGARRQAFGRQAVPKAKPAPTQSTPVVTASKRPPTRPTSATTSAASAGNPRTSAKRYVTKGRHKGREMIAPDFAAAHLVQSGAWARLPLPSAKNTRVVGGDLPEPAVENETALAGRVLRVPMEGLSSASSEAPSNRGAAGSGATVGGDTTRARPTELGTNHTDRERVRPVFDHAPGGGSSLLRR